MRTALVTCAIGEEHQREFVLTRPTFMRYAERFGFHLVVLEEHTIGFHPIFEKMRCGQLLDEFDRVIFVDADVVIAPDCPDLTKLVPADKFGAYLVSRDTPFHDGAIALIQSVLPDLGWRRDYFNSGVMVFSRAHQRMFDASDPDFARWSAVCSERTIGKTFADQTYLNYKLQQLGLPLQDIGYRYNHTLAPKNSATRYASSIIHCKGHRRGTRLEEIRRTRLIVENRVIRRLMAASPTIAGLYDAM